MNVCVAGFRHGERGPFVPAKGPKTMLAVAWPFGFPARFADSGGAQTRYAQTVRALSPESAALLCQATRPGGLGKAMSP
ncbi:MAG: hypothetical protein H0W49_15725 [Nitrospirales bacterium]|nr:hypothetical protein [Nitrospirales bacterium]MBA3965970.1 hypothetical protein [Nitrospirales bacterium]